MSRFPLQEFFNSQQFFQVFNDSFEIIYNVMILTNYSIV